MDSATPATQQGHQGKAKAQTTVQVEAFKDRTIKNPVGPTISRLTTMWALVITSGPSKLETSIASKMPTTHKLAQ